MPRSLTDDDFRQFDAIYVLIGAQRRLDIRGLEEQTLTEMMPRYLREAEKRGVTLPPFYPDIVTDRYPEIYQAVVYAMSFDLMTPRMASTRWQVNTDFAAWLRSSLYLTHDEILRLREAAGVVIEKHARRELNDDLEENQEKTASA